jgi:hypothetical protein
MCIYNIEWLVKPKANGANAVANEVVANAAANAVEAAKPLMRGVMVVSFHLR